MKKKTQSRKTIQNRCDKNWSKAVKIAADHTCQMCNTKKEDLNGKQVLNSHHIVARKYKNYRWYLANGVCLCFRCHAYFAHGDDFMAQLKWHGFMDHRHNEWMGKRYGIYIYDITYDVANCDDSIKDIPMAELREIDAALIKAVSK